MGLMDKLLARIGHGHGGIDQVHVQLLLDDAGRVQCVRIKRSSGDSTIDGMAIRELESTRYPHPRLGKKTVRRWHDVVWTSGFRGQHTRNT